MHEERFPPKSRVGTIYDEERFSPKSRVGAMSEEERYKKSLTSSPLYHSTLDNLVDEDNVVRVTEDLKKIVEEHGRYISAHHDGLQTRNHRVALGLAILVVILITIIAAFATALAWKSSHIREMEDTVNAIKEELDKKITAAVQSQMDHQIAFRGVWRKGDRGITFDQLIFTKGSSSFDLKTGTWTAAARGTYMVTVATDYSRTPIDLLKNGRYFEKMHLNRTMNVATKVVLLSKGETLSLKAGGEARFYGLYFSVSFLSQDGVLQKAKGGNERLFEIKADFGNNEEDDKNRDYDSFIQGLAGKVEDHKKGNNDMFI